MQKGHKRRPSSKRKKHHHHQHQKKAPKADRVKSGKSKATKDPSEEESWDVTTTTPEHTKTSDSSEEVKPSDKKHNEKSNEADDDKKVNSFLSAHMGRKGSFRNAFCSSAAPSAISFVTEQKNP